MTLKEAIQRLQWRFKSGKEFTPNQNDADSLNEIIRFINLNSKQEVNSNMMLDKMYAFMLTELITRYKNIEVANDKLNNLVFTKSLQYHLLILTDRLKTYELDLYLSSEGVKDDSFGQGLTKDEIKKRYNENKETLKNIDIHKILETYEAWDFDSVSSNFEFNFNIALKNFRNV